MIRAAEDMEGFMYNDEWEELWAKENNMEYDEEYDEYYDKRKPRKQKTEQEKAGLNARVKRVGASSKFGMSLKRFAELYEP